MTVFNRHSAPLGFLKPNADTFLLSFACRMIYNFITILILKNTKNLTVDNLRFECKD